MDDGRPRDTEAPGEAAGDLGPEVTAALPALRRLATAVTGSPETGAGLVAAAAGATARRADLADPASWLTTVVTNRAIQRAVGRAGSASGRHSRAYLPQLFARYAGRREEASMLALRAALAQMSPQDRAAVLLRYVHGLEEEAVAQALGWRRLRLPPRLYAGVTSLGAALSTTEVADQATAARWDRVVTALRAFVDDLPDLPDRGPARARLRWRPWLVATAALAPALLVGVVLGVAVLSAPTPSAAGSVATAYLPSELPAYSWLTGDAAGSPPGPALVAWAQGPAVGLLGRPEFLVLGAGGAQVRRVAQAEAGDAGGGTRPALLSPDGRTLALGTTRGNGVLELVDLTTGSVTVRSPLGRGDVWPAAWSPRGDVLWAVRVDRTDPASGEAGRRPAGPGLARRRFLHGSGRRRPGRPARGADLARREVSRRAGRRRAGPRHRDAGGDRDVGAGGPAHPQRMVARRPPVAGRGGLGLAVVPLSGTALGAQRHPRPGSRQQPGCWGGRATRRHCCGCPRRVAQPPGSPLSTWAAGSSTWSAASGAAGPAPESAS
ncbi:MAG: sigma factor-like helix-turn-helix DNA-binding protein [Nocardioides sp.]